MPTGESQAIEEARQAARAAALRRARRERARQGLDTSSEAIEDEQRAQTILAQAQAQQSQQNQRPRPAPPVGQSEPADTRAEHLGQQGGEEVQEDPSGLDPFEREQAEHRRRRAQRFGALAEAFGGQAQEPPIDPDVAVELADRVGVDPETFLGMSLTEARETARAFLEPENLELRRESIEERGRRRRSLEQRQQEQIEARRQRQKREFEFKTDQMNRDQAFQRELEKFKSDLRLKEMSREQVIQRVKTLTQSLRDTGIDIISPQEDPGFFQRLQGIDPSRATQPQRIQIGITLRQLQAHGQFSKAQVDQMLEALGLDPTTISAAPGTPTGQAPGRRRAQAPRRSPAPQNRGGGGGGTRGRRGRRGRGSRGQQTPQPQQNQQTPQAGGGELMDALREDFRRQAEELRQQGGQ